MNTLVGELKRQAQRVMRYCRPMPLFHCTLASPKPLIAKFTHRIPCEVDISRNPQALQQSEVILRLRWISQKGDSLFAGQIPILRGGENQNLLRVIVTVQTPESPGKYALSAALARGRREKWLTQSETAWEIVSLEQSNGNYHYGEYMIGLDASSRCNLDCIFCLRTFLEHQPPSEISPAEIEQLAREAFDCCSGLSLSLGAEPLLNTQMDRILEQLSRYPYLFTTMTTNGTPLGERIIRLLVEKQYKEICVSLDGATKETYESIRKGARFEQVIGNLRRLQAVKKEQGSVYPIVKFNFAMMRRNIQEIPAFVDLAKELGAVEIRFQYFMIPHESLTDECLWFDQARTNQYLQEAKQKCEAYGIRLDAPPLFDLNRKPGDQRKLRTQQCRWPWKGILLSPEGDAYPCCQWKGPVLGNVKEQGFEAVWNGAGFQQLRRDWITQELNEYCRNCSALWEGDVNNFSSFLAAEYELINGKKPPIYKTPDEYLTPLSVKSTVE